MINIVVATDEYKMSTQHSVTFICLSWKVCKIMIIIILKIYIVSVNVHEIIKCALHHKN